MKSIVIIFAAISGLFTGSLSTAEEVVAALRSGKASELVRHFDEKVTIKLLNQEDLLSRAQAEANLRHFFEKYPVKQFTASHTSSVNNASQYIIGTLEAGGGRFKVSIFMRRGLVLQFRIEQENG